MNNDLILGATRIDKGRVQRIASPRGRRIECLRGTLWITQDGDLRDIVLSPGESFEFDRPKGVLVSALDDSRYLLLDDRAAPRH